MSIQCELDGHSFSCTRLSDGKTVATVGVATPAETVGDEVVAPVEVATPAEPVEVEVLTLRTVLVPEEVFAEKDAALWMGVEGKQPRADETPVCSAPRNGLVALMALPSTALQQLRNEFGDEATFAFTSPLAEIDDLRTAAWHLTLRGKYLYALITREGLQLAEVVAVASEADTLWLIDHLAKTFPTASCVLNLRGDALAKQRKEIAKRFKFKKIQCA